MAHKAVSVLCACLVGGALVATPPAGAREGEQIAPGVRFEDVYDPSGPFQIQVVTVDLAAASTLDVALAGDQLPGFETVSSMARRHHAVAAINADYALPSGRPVHAYAEDGRLLQAPARIESSFAVDQRETTGYIGIVPALEMSIGQGSEGRRYPVHRVNDGLPGRDEIAAFTSEEGAVEKAGEWCAARLEASSAPRSRDGESVEIEYVVRKSRCATGLLDPDGDEVVLATSPGATYAPLVRSLEPGEPITLVWSVGWPGVFDLTGGNPVLVFRGEVAAGVEQPEGGGDAFFDRQPRTGVGVTRDGQVLLVTVDGRQPSYSVGMTLREFAELFQRLGAVDALNLDGGGSTTMVVDGVVRNRPAGSARERAVASALLVLPGDDRGEREAERFEEQALASPVTIPALWTAIASDPGSTGGLSASLQRRGLPLSPALQETARLFQEALRLGAD